MRVRRPVLKAIIAGKSVTRNWRGPTARHRTVSPDTRAVGESVDLPRFLLKSKEEEE